MTDYVQSQHLDAIRRELARQSVLLEQLLDGFVRLREQLAVTTAAVTASAPAAAPQQETQPASGALRRALRRLRAALTAR